jgi:hypothetical protein
MISYKTVRQNSRLTQFEGTKELVVRNVVPKVSHAKVADSSTQSQLFQF